MVWPEVRVSKQWMQVQMIPVTGRCTPTCKCQVAIRGSLSAMRKSCTRVVTGAMAPYCVWIIGDVGMRNDGCKFCEFGASAGAMPTNWAISNGELRTTPHLYYASLYGTRSTNHLVVVILA
jgi:hypothetical protein